MSGTGDQDHPPWISSEQHTVVGVLQQAARQHADKTFLEFSGTHYSYKQVWEDAQSVARGLIELGAAQGQTIASLLDNNYDCIVSWFGINIAGCVSVPINTAYKGEFLRHQLGDSGAAIVIAEADYTDRVLAISDQLPELTTLLHRGSAPEDHAEGVHIAPFEEMQRGGESVERDIQPGDLAMLIYTGGTTGPSKGCMISHNYACNFARQSNRGQAYSSEDVIWTPLPMFHFNGTVASVLAGCMAGAQISIYPRFSTTNFWPEIERTGATVAGILGSMIVFIAEAEDSDESKACYGQLRSIRGAPFPAEMQKIWRDRFGVKRCGSNLYGLSEASAVTMLNFDEEAPPGSSGKSCPEFDVRIVDDHDNELPAGEAGEVICRPRMPHVMFEGYWRRPEDTMRVMRNLWFHTGDIGKFDEDGFFFFVDRKKDYLRRRGENISSFEVETAFRAYPEVEDLAAHAVLSDKGEDDLKVTIVLKAGATVTEEQLCQWSFDELPYFAVPRYIEFRPELPRNPVGRILKYKLREEGCTPATWDLEKSGLQLKKR